jgi:hypothetical protein
VKVGTTSVTVSVANSTQITFTYPSLVAGTYPIVVRVGAANAYPTFVSTTELWLGSFSFSSGSNRGGLISLSGNGFKASNTIVNYDCGVFNNSILPIDAITPNNLTFIVPSYPSSTCLINVTMGTFAKPMNYSQTTANTPTISIEDLGSGQFKLTVLTLTSKKINFVNARYLDSNGGYTSSAYPMNWVSTGTNIFTASPAGSYLPCGTFAIEVHFWQVGFASIPSEPSTFTKTCDSTTFTSSAVSVSYGGGSAYEITGAGFHTIQ